MKTYDDIKKASECIQVSKLSHYDKKLKTEIETDYAPVHQKIKAFRMLYPEGFIITEMLSNVDGVCVFRATAGYYNDEGEAVTLGVGHAYEREGSSFINETSYIENSETSAIGRCISSIGLGIDTSVASYEEVANAKLNQGPRTATESQVNLIKKLLSEKQIIGVLSNNRIKDLSELSLEKASDIISWAKERREAQQ